MKTKNEFTKISTEHLWDIYQKGLPVDVAEEAYRYLGMWHEAREYRNTVIKQIRCEVWRRSRTAEPPW